MAGGLTKYRHLSRNSAQRQALLRGLVTSLVRCEKIHTTWHKAKEAQRLADKLITLAKRNSEPARRKAQAILYTPHLYIDKLFGELRQRYLLRPGGYTRVLRTETKDTYSQQQSAVLEYVDNARDSRFNMAARTVARHGGIDGRLNDTTRLNVRKALQFRPHGHAAFREAVRHLAAGPDDGDDGDKNTPSAGHPTRRKKTVPAFDEHTLVTERVAACVEELGPEAAARHVAELQQLEDQRLRDVARIRERAGLKAPDAAPPFPQQERLRLRLKKKAVKTPQVRTRKGLRKGVRMPGGGPRRATS